MDENYNMEDNHHSLFQTQMILEWRNFTNFKANSYNAMQFSSVQMFHLGNFFIP